MDKTITRLKRKRANWPAFVSPHRQFIAPRIVVPGTSDTSQCRVSPDRDMSSLYAPTANLRSFDPTIGVLARTTAPSWEFGMYRVSPDRS